MKSERYLIKRFLKMSIFGVLFILGSTFTTGFYYKRDIYVKLNDITIELGEKLPEEITSYANILSNKSNLSLETTIPLDENGNTKEIGTYDYYLAYNDNYYKYSELTNTKSTITVIDTINPIIKIKNNKFNYSAKINVDSIATCSDLSGCTMELKEKIDSTKSGEHVVTITAYDAANNTSSITTKITIKEKPKPVYNYSYSYKNMNEHNNAKNALLTEEEKENLRNQIATFAKKFIGNPYVYGGSSLTKGTDCSGFTMLLYANYGYILPRISVNQAYVGKDVSANELKPGDIVVYFHEGHVGLYVGNGMMVHASNSRSGIVYAKMYPGYRLYRRIIY